MARLERPTSPWRRLPLVLPLLALLSPARLAAQGGFMETIDAGAGVLVGWLAAVFFYDVMFWDAEHQLPLVVLWLVIGAIFLTFKMGFINFR
ncbi:MAG: hypothetical protein ABR602_05405, partial [Gemmatimonadales bacterium]